MSATFLPSIPPVDWTITLPETLEFHRKHNADVSLYVLARTVEPCPIVTYGQFVNACQRVPRLVRLSPPENGATKPVIALVMNTDTITYHAIMMGIILSGAVPFPISPRNTVEAVVHLIQASLSSKLILTSASLGKLATEIREALCTQDSSWNERVQEPPAISQLYPDLVPGSATENGKPADQEDAMHCYKPDLNSICIYLHSSGSTGLPKAIPVTHYEVIKYMRFPSATQFRPSGGLRIQLACMELPPFHGMAFTFQLCAPLFHGASLSILYPAVLTPSAAPLVINPESVIELIDRSNANACFTIPAFLEVWVHDRRSVDILKKLKFVIHGGGPLSPKVGLELVKSGVKLRVMYGGTEFGAVAMCSTRPGDEDDWEYLEFAEESDAYFSPQGDGTYELQFISPKEYPRSVTNIEGVNGYATSDLLKRHPTKNHLWILAGRDDAVIVHSSGEKTVPTPMEHAIQGSPIVRGAVMFGAGKLQPGVLIEPRDAYAIDVTDAIQVAKLRNLVWPDVEAANRGAPGFSKIFKEMILFTSRDKPLPRTPKMTILAKASWKLYADEIDNLYSNISSDSISSSTLKAWTPEELTKWLVSQVEELCSRKDISLNSNLFEQGFDSLMAAILQQRIASAIQVHMNTGERAERISDVFNLIYKYPTVNTLARYLTSSEYVEAPSKRDEEIERIISKYSIANENIKGTKAAHNSPQSRTILLTGSTGSLGSHVLEKLLSDHRTDRIYALNRPDSRTRISERHLRQFREKGLDENLLSSPKLVHIECNSWDQRLGIEEGLYEEVRTTVDVIIHIAWKMDFNLSLESFEPNIQATHNLAALARESPKSDSVLLLFVSSVGVAQSWDPHLGLYPELVVDDAKYSVGSGYGEAKYVCERILSTSGLAATTVRFGQIAGSEATGAWPPSDWVPILLQSSVAMGTLPTEPGNISWLSSDIAASVVVEVAFHDKEVPPVLNVVPPNTTTWDMMIRHVQDALKIEYGLSLPLIHYQEWLSILIDAASTSKDTASASRIPAIKLVGFFHSLGQRKEAQTSEAFGLPVFQCQKMRTISATLYNVNPLSGDDVRRWMRYWTKKQLFRSYAVVENSTRQAES